MTKQMIKPTMAILLFLQGALGAAPFEAQGLRLTINSSSLAVSFRGPDVVAVTNRLTGESYLRASAPYTLSDLALSPPSSEALSAGAWSLNSDGTGATLIAAGGTRSISIAVSIDSATQEIVVSVSGLSEQSEVRRLSWVLSVST